MKARLTDPRDYMTPSWDLVQPSVRLLREHYLPLLYLFVLPGLVYVLGGLFIGTSAGYFSWGHMTGRQLGGLVTIVVGLLWTLINLVPSLLFRLTAAQGHSLPLGDYYRQGLPLFFRVIGLYILTGLLVVVGFIALIVPGFIFFRRYYLAPYYLVDQRLSIRKSMRVSAHESRPVSGYIWGIIGVQAVFSLFASFCSIIPAVGIIIGVFVGYICLFLPSLRYLEVVKANTPPKPKKTKSTAIK